MKLIHISDLHIGKRVHEFSMIKDQIFILNRIIDIAVNKNIDAVLISGDIYDKSVPTVEAVDVFDDFITRLWEKEIIVVAISGNHDSPERIDYGSRIMGKHNVYIAGNYKGEIPAIKFQDSFGDVNIYAMPYLKPSVVNKVLNVQTKTFEECVSTVLEKISINVEKRNILLAHQFITASGAVPERSESESKTLGGTDNIDASVFDAFDYVALGHIHRPQQIGRELVRYSGSPLKYSFSESNHKKSAVIIDLQEKGNISYYLEPLIPINDMRELRCTLEELRSGRYYDQIPKESYVHITLTDESEIVDAIGKVRDIYPNVMLFDFDNERTRSISKKAALSDRDIKEKTPLELFQNFYEMQHNNASLSKAQLKILEEIISELD